MDYQEIVKIIDKKEKAKQRKEARKRKLAEEEQTKRMQELKEQAAQALNKAGVLTEEELKLIREDTTMKVEKSTPAVKKDENKEDKTDNTKQDDETDDK